MSTHTFEECRLIALKYAKKVDWQTSGLDTKYYSFSYRRGWLKELCSHMRRGESAYCVYCYEFEDETAYVGVTRNFARRYAWHRSCGVIKKSKCKIKKSTILETGVTAETAGERELYWFEELSKTHRMIQSAKHIGALGPNSTARYTVEECMKSAETFKRRVDWWRAKPSMYAYARYHGWLSKCCAHMKQRAWTVEDCVNAAKKYASTYQWRKSSDAKLYTYAFRHGTLELCKSNLSRGV